MQPASARSWSGPAGPGTAFSCSLPLVRRLIMRRCVLLATIGLFGPATLLAAEPPSQGGKEAPTKATYLISGLHCPPCAKTVEGALLKTKGVRSAHVDWNAKNA